MHHDRSEPDRSEPDRLESDESGLSKAASVLSLSSTDYGRRSAESKPIENLPENGSRISFKDAVISGYKNTFDYKGRATRAEYWWWVLFTIVASIVLYVVGQMAGVMGILLSRLFERERRR